LKCFVQTSLTLYLLTWIIWWAPKNVSRGHMGFNSAFFIIIIVIIVIIIIMFVKD
jgi:hypothetical protein